MELRIDLETGRTACAESAESFVAAIDGLDERELLDASRCHGWTRLDVVVHVIHGWYEMLGGLVSPVDEPPTVDAASYWPAFADQFGSDDPIPALMSQRRRTAAYARPASAVAELGDVGAAIGRGIAACADRPLLWQGHVFAAGDYLAVWAVEQVVHHLDLDTDHAAPASALGVTRATVEALLGEPLPPAWSDTDAVLVGTGRATPPADLGPLAQRLPVIR